MRRTLTIDDDVLGAAKATAEQQARSLVDVISELARSSLRRPQSGASRNGFPLLPFEPDMAPMTLHIVNKLRS